MEPGSLHCARAPGRVSRQNGPELPPDRNEGNHGMPDKPSYLGLLNAIADRRTPRARVPHRLGRCHHRARRARGAAHHRRARRRARHELSRSGSTSSASSCSPPTTRASTKVEIVTSDCTDLEKLESARAAAVLTRRRARRLRQLLPRPLDRHPAPASCSVGTSPRSATRCGCSRAVTPSSAADGRQSATASLRPTQLARLEDKLDALCRGVEELRQIVSRRRCPQPPSGSVHHRRRSALRRARGSRLGRRPAPAPSDDDIRTIHRGLLGHGVLFFREQPLDRREHLTLARRSATPAFPLSRAHRHRPESGRYITDTADSPPDADGWHTDITWIADRLRWRSCRP